MNCFFPKWVAVLTVAFAAISGTAIGQENTAPRINRASPSTQEQGDPPPGELMKVTEIEGISEYRLENGARVLLFPDQSKEVVTVNMTVFVGSRHEGYGEAGMAHLLEHMLFKGTPERPEIPKLLEELGARFNGTTSVDRTNYYETVPASDENLRAALELEADRLTNSFIKGEDLASEMTVVRNEFERSENSPFRVLLQRMSSAAYDWHNYGRTTIGNRSDIERVPVVSLRRFYRKYYRPDNVLLIVAGRFDSARTLGMISETFGRLESPDTPIDPTYTTEPAKDGERTVVLRRVGEVQLVGAGYHIPAGSHPDFAAVRALSIILGDEPSGRLYRQLVEEEIASSISTFALPSAEPGLMVSFAEVSVDDSIDAGQSALISVLEESFAETPVTEQEVDRAKQQMLKQRELDSSNTTQLAVSLSEWAAQGDWRLYFLFRDSVEQLTADQVQQVAEKYLVRNNRTVGLFLPTETAQRISIPEAPSLTARLEGYKGREVVQAGEQFDPDPLKIEQRTIRGELESGIEYALLPKRTRGGSVSMLLTLRFGSAETMIDRLGAVEVLGTLMGRGTETLDYQAFQDELTRLRAEMSFSTVPGLLQVNVKTKREFLPEVIKLIGDVLRKPRLSSDELDVIKRQIVTGLRQGSSEPTTLAALNVRRALSPYGPDDIRYVQTIDEQIQMYESVSADEVKELHEDLLSSRVGELAIVGDFEPDQTTDQLESVLKNWKSDVAYKRVNQPPNTDVKGNLATIRTPDKANAFFIAQMQMEIDDTDPEFAALVMGNYILGGGGLSSRLADRVRQKEGLSYTVQSQLASRAKDKRADLILYAIANPKNKDRLIEVIREEIDRLVREGVTPIELDKAKTAYLQSLRVRRTDDSALTSELLQTMFLDRTMQYAADQSERIESLTVEEVNSAIRKYIDWNRLVMAVSGDFDADGSED